MKKKLINIICALGIIIYVIFGTNFLDNLKESTASVSNVINEAEKKIIDDKIDDELRVYFIDVGQADSIFIENNGHNMLIDAGNNADGKKLVNYLKDLGVKQFDYVISTHPHEDHIGGMDDIISNFEINMFYMPDVITTTKTFEDVLDALENKNLKYSVPVEDDEFKLGTANVKVLYIDNQSANLNDSSIVLKLTFGKNSFLFTGDASEKVEKKIIKKDLNSEVLKVGHHGSSYSTSKDFLDKVNPKYTVISVGKDNIYNHPTNDTLSRLKNTKLYRTDYDGTIIFTSDGCNIKVETIKTDTNG